MIEVVYKGEENREQEKIALPKNVRQVGEVHKDRRIYIEDYVVTYIRQKITENKNLGCILILTGHREYVQDVLYLFADGAFQVDYTQVGPDYSFTDRVWETIYETVKKHFISGEIVGWLLYDDDLSEDRLLKAQKKNFPTEDMLLLKRESYEEESECYLYQNGMLRKLPGYFVYYEKNEAMQEFMVSSYQSQGGEEEALLRQREAPVAHFRTRMKERKEISNQNRTMNALYAVSSVLVLIVILIGITMVNNYDKMKDMEHSLNDLAQTAAQRELEESAREENEGILRGEGTADESADANGEQKDMTSLPAVSDEGQAGTTTEGSHEMASVEILPSGVEANGDDKQGEPGGDVEAESTAGQNPESTQEETEAETASSEAQPVSASEASPVYYTIEPGDTLAGISKKVYGNAGVIGKICAANGIEDGDKILAGQKIILP